MKSMNIFKLFFLFLFCITLIFLGLYFVQNHVNEVYYYRMVNFEKRHSKNGTLFDAIRRRCQNFFFDINKNPCESYFYIASNSDGAGSSAFSLLRGLSYANYSDICFGGVFYENPYIDNFFGGSSNVGHVSHGVLTSVYFSFFFADMFPFFRTTDDVPSFNFIISDVFEVSRVLSNLSFYYSLQHRDPIHIFYRGSANDLKRVMPRDAAVEQFLAKRRKEFSDIAQCSATEALLFWGHLDLEESNKMNVVCHLRIGDVGPHSGGRWTPFSYYEMIFELILQEFPNAQIRVFSTLPRYDPNGLISQALNSLSSFAEINAFDEASLANDPHEATKRVLLDNSFFLKSDVFIGSSSSFSYMAANFRHGKCSFLPWGRNSTPPLAHGIRYLRLNMENPTILQENKIVLLGGIDNFCK